MELEYGHPYAPRVLKANKILAVLKDFMGDELGQNECLDVGCHKGLISSYLAPHFRMTIGIDLNESAVRLASMSKTDDLLFIAADGQFMPFTDSSFGIVVCVQLYEHVTNQEGLKSEIWRVLKPGGICFFSGPNRLAFIEEHYWLPLLSWLPQPLAGFYLRVARRGKRYDIKPLLYWQLRRLWEPFIIHDYTIAMIREPERFNVQDRLGGNSWVSRLPRFLLKRLQPFFPNYNWLLVKPS